MLGFSIPSRGSHLTDCLSEGGVRLRGGLALLVLILIVRVLVVPKLVTALEEECWQGALVLELLY